VIVTAPEVPVLKPTGPVFVIVKSGPVAMLTGIDKLWTENPAFPLTVTVYVPGEPVQDRVDVSGPPIARLLEESKQLTCEDDGLAVRLVVAEKPCERVRVIVVVPVALPIMFTVAGLALKPKSGRWSVPQILLSTIPKAKSNSVAARSILIEKSISMRKPED